MIGKYKKTLFKPNIKKSDIEDIRLDIFSKIRSFDGLDDDKHRYNTNEAIRTRVTPNILNNKELNKDSFVKNSFDLVKNFLEVDKKEFYLALDSGKDNLNRFFEKIKLYETLGITNTDEKNNLLENIFNSLKEGKNNIDDGQLKEVITSEINSKINYLKLHKTPENENEINKKIEELEFSLDNENLKEHIENIKLEVIYKSFERIIISETLEKKSSLVKELSSKNTDINLYRDIEGIGNKFSDETFNSISSKTQFLAEQIAIMYISGGVGSMALKGIGGVARIGETTNLLKGGMNLSNIGKMGLNTTLEGGVFYLSYTGLNGLVNKKEAKQLFEDINSYDAIRTIIFLGVLRAFSNTTEAFTTKNILLDTRNILGTDLIIRSSLGQLLGKEAVNGIDFNNLKSSDLKEFGKILAEELEFIIPLVIGLRLSERTVSNAFKSKENPQIEVIPRENDYIIKIEGVQKEIRILKQNRNILRNKGKDTSEVKQALQEKKAEYQDLRDNQPENLSEHNQENVNDMLIQENQANPHKNDTKNKKSNSDENTNMNTGVSSKFLNLEKYSKEAQKGKIDYALKDENIEGVLTQKGVGEKGKSVGEGLLKKSGFDESEIKDYNDGKLKSEKAENLNEKKALKEMERANEVIYKGFMELKTNIKEGTMNGISLRESLKNYSEKHYIKIINIMKKDGYLF